MFIEYYLTCYIMITIQTMDLHTALVSHLDEASGFKNNIVIVK